MDASSIDWQLVLGPLLASSGGCFSDEIADLCQAARTHSPRAIRLRPTRSVDQLPFVTEPVPWYDRGRLLASGAVEAETRPGAFLNHAAGDYYIQDSGSMLALALADIVPGQLVCDTCAAPGGKSTGILEELAGQGLLLSNEVIGSRLPILKAALARSGYGNHMVTSLDVEQLALACGAAFDRVLVDAPCSGQSLVSRGKQSFSAFSSTQMEHSAARQQRILSAAAKLVRPGGRLIYSTCTFAYIENEAIVSDFLGKHPDWRPREMEQLAPWRSSIQSGCYRLWPHRHPSAGAFAAVLELHGDGQAAIGGTASSRSQWEPLSQGMPSIDWFQEILPGQWWRARGEIHRFDASIPSEWIVHAVSGTAVAEMKKNQRCEPLYGSSTLDRTVGAPTRSLELADDQAVRYIAGQSLKLHEPRLGDWCGVKWRGRPLSWGKLTKETLKNHFPKILRQTVSIQPLIYTQEGISAQ